MIISTFITKNCMEISDSLVLASFDIISFNPYFPGLMQLPEITPRENLTRKTHRNT